MKFSKFNSVINLSEKTLVLYNSMSDKSIFVKRSSFNPTVIPDETSILYAQLLKNEFILKDSIDETERFINYAREIENSDHSFHLLINPTINCNFNCWYCYETHKQSKMSDKVISNIIKLISTIFDENKTLQISFFGGEPLLYFNQVMIPILEKVKKLALDKNGQFFVNMTTNGYLLSHKKVEKLKEYNFNGAQITLDGNESDHNKVRFHSNGSGSYSEIIKNIKDLARNDIPVVLRINCTNNCINGVPDIMQAFSDLDSESKKNINVDLHIVWQESDRDSVLSKMGEVAKIFLDNGIVASKMSFREFCYADKRSSFLINYNGDVYKCTAVDFQNTSRDGFLNDKGIVEWDGNSLENRLLSKFKNKSCFDCRVFPLCHGGCTKTSLNYTSEYCLHDYNEDEKDRLVLDRIEYNIAHSHLK